MERRAKGLFLKRKIVLAVLPISYHMGRMCTILCVEYGLALSTL